MFAVATWHDGLVRDVNAGRGWVSMWGRGRQPVALEVGVRACDCLLMIARTTAYIAKLLSTAFYFMKI